MNLNKLIIPLFSVLAATSLQAQECLSFTQALNLSAQQDPAVIVARARQQEAESDLEEARSLYRPQVSAFARTGSGNTDVVDSNIQNQLGVRVTQRIFDFGNAKYTREAADFNLQAAGEDIIQAAAQQVALSFLQAQTADQRLAATAERQDYFRRQLTSVDKLLKQGGATLSDRADVAAQLADAEAFYLELQFQKQQALTQIAINTDVELPLCQTQDVAAILQSRLESLGSRETAVAEALQQSPLIKALRGRANSFNAEYQREKRNRLPIVEVVGVGSYSSTESSDDFEFQDRIGIDVSVPIYTGNALTAQRQRSASREAAARGELQDALRQLREQVQITWYRTQSLQQQLYSRETVADEYLKQLQAAEVEYDLGTRTLPDLVEVRLEYEQGTLERIQAELELMQQRVLLIALTATLPLNEPF